MYKNVEVTGSGLFLVCGLVSHCHFLLAFLFMAEKNRKKRLLESHLYLLELFNGIFPLEKSLMATLYFFNYNHTYLICGSYIYIKDRHR